MRNLSELIVLVRGGGEAGSAIAHRLFRSHFRVCITEIASPLPISRYTCFSEAVYDNSKTIEDVTAERTSPSLEQIYRLWRDDKIPIVVDPELTVKALFKPDVLINAMMLNRETNTRISDAPLVIGIGPGFTAGEDVHAVVESGDSNSLGRVIFEGKADGGSGKSLPQSGPENVIWAEDSGVFTTEKQICDTVAAEEVIGRLDDTPVKAPISGTIRGLLRSQARVLSGARLAEIDPSNDKSACFFIRNRMRAVAGGALEAIMLRCNGSSKQ